ncbi:hypothetical protein GCM10023193_18150 [Planotetraspora kaengkrachanensis]|uniref:Uncharacterized protein n=1 Tax=Planotetraspora kaengkrachanensis TaxID=575193 RepID=A0A8J3M099_9ACTN|nr:hypothetical protein Pka01_28350 [Planotetraspora kaengkrachanensis]
MDGMLVRKTRMFLTSHSSEAAFEAALPEPYGAPDRSATHFSPHTFLGVIMHRFAERPSACGVPRRDHAQIRPGHR